MNRKFKKNILCIGAGYVGGPTMAVIAAKCPEYKITVVDINEQKINDWNSGNIPIFEPGLEEIVNQVKNKNLFFSTNIEKGIEQADIIFVSVNTPTKTFGEGAGKTADLQYWEKTARSILQASRNDKVVVEKSTLPVKTAEAMERILNSGDDNINFQVVSNPEFLAEGTAIQDLLNPDRVLIGSRETPEGIKARKQIVEIYRHWIPVHKIITSNIWSSELSKLVSNAFLAQRISSINSISALCEKTGADVEEVAYSVGSDSRIGDKFLSASVGFGGSCFKKDILNLVYICESYGLYEVAEYWENVVKINEFQEQRFVRNISKAMFNTIANKKITLFGFAFKANTGDTRESAAIYVTRELLAEHALVTITDPQALDNAKIDLKDHIQQLSFESDPYQAAVGAHAIAVLTEWDVYPKLDYQRIFDSMEKPAFIFDGRNILDHRKLFEIGFNVYPVGKPHLNHF
ncbi:MAG: UDP-glucose 6-dehydrogenase [Desulfuromonas sp. SDB]|nr:MAG: UDP-glucose 6-dehydrogenase [Desulfuromonas sp. SDB]